MFLKKLNFRKSHENCNNFVVVGSQKASKARGKGRWGKGVTIWKERLLFDRSIYKNLTGVFTWQGALNELQIVAVLTLKAEMSCLKMNSLHITLVSIQSNFAKSNFPIPL